MLRQASIGEVVRAPRAGRGAPWRAPRTSAVGVPPADPLPRSRGAWPNWAAHVANPRRVVVALQGRVRRALPASLSPRSGRTTVGTSARNRRSPTRRGGTIWASRSTEASVPPPELTGSVQFSRYFLWASLLLDQNGACRGQYQSGQAWSDEKWKPFAGAHGHVRRVVRCGRRAGRLSGSLRRSRRRWRFDCRCARVGTSFCCGMDGNAWL